MIIECWNDFLRKYFNIQEEWKKNQLPNEMLFELGFGYKYQHLISMLILSIINNKITEKDLYKLQNFSKKHFNNNGKMFASELKKLIPLLKKLTYNENCIVLLEGDDCCLEDINIFYHIPNHNIYLDLIQVKSSADINSNYLKSKIKPKIIEFVNSKNINTKSRLIFISNMIDSIDKNAEFRKICKGLINSKNSDFKKAAQLFADIKFNNPSESFDIFMKNSYQNLHRRHSPYIKEVDQKISKALEVLKNMIIVSSLDYRLIYNWLFYSYGKKEFLNLLNNIELKTMNGDECDISEIKNKLEQIQLNKSDIKNIHFSSSGNKFRKGTIF